jgi:hypothetical protein
MQRMIALRASDTQCNDGSEKLWALALGVIGDARIYERQSDIREPLARWLTLPTS